MPLTNAQKAVFGLVFIETLVKTIFVITAACIVNSDTRSTSFLVENAIFLISGFILPLAITVEAMVFKNTYLLMAALLCILLSSLAVFTFIIVVAVFPTTQVTTSILIVAIEYGVLVLLILVALALAWTRVRQEFRWKIYETIGGDLKARHMVRLYYITNTMLCIHLLFIVNQMLSYVWLSFFSDLIVREDVTGLYRLLLSIVFLLGVIAYWMCKFGTWKYKSWMLLIGWIALLASCVCLGFMAYLAIAINQNLFQFVVTLLLLMMAAVTLLFVTRSWRHLGRGFTPMLHLQESLHKAKTRRLTLE